MNQTAFADWVLESEFAFGSALADMDGDIEAYRELGTIYAEELPRQLTLLEAVGADVARLLPLLHEAANTLGVIGARLYARKIRDIEEELRAGHSRDLHAAARNAAEAMKRTGQALESWLSSRSS